MQVQKGFTLACICLLSLSALHLPGQSGLNVLGFGLNDLVEGLWVFVLCFLVHYPLGACLSILTRSKWEKGLEPVAWCQGLSRFEIRIGLWNYFCWARRASRDYSVHVCAFCSLLCTIFSHIRAYSNLKSHPHFHTHSSYFHISRKGLPDIFS